MTFFRKLMDAFARPRATALYIGGASAAVLGAAYTSQYAFGLDPCILCYYQRIPYVAVIALSALAFFTAARCGKTTTALLFLCGLLFLADAGIAGFHVGVEHHWWKGLEACGNAAMPVNASLEELQAFISSRDVVRCDVPAFTLFGISMAGYNMLLALGLALDTFILMWWRRRWQNAK